jgi:hypothetical protein
MSARGPLRSAFACALDYGFGSTRADHDHKELTFDFARRRMTAKECECRRLFPARSGRSRTTALRTSALGSRPTRSPLPGHGEEHQRVGPATGRQMGCLPMKASPSGVSNSGRISDRIKLARSMPLGARLFSRPTQRLVGQRSASEAHRAHRLDPRSLTICTSSLQSAQQRRIE